MILQREREREGGTMRTKFEPSLLQFIGLSYRSRFCSFKLINDKEFREKLWNSRGRIYYFVSFFPFAFYRGQRHDTRFERRTWKKFSSGSCSSIRDRVCSHVCTYMCVSGDRMLSTRSSKQLERLHSEGQYRTSRVQNTLDKKHL